MEELAGGLWRGTARHGEWHPGEWGAQVASFALDAGGVLLLVDPLLPEDDAEVLERLDALALGDAIVTHGEPVLRDGSRRSTPSRGTTDEFLTAARSNR